MRRHLAHIPLYLSQLYFISSVKLKLLQILYRMLSKSHHFFLCQPQLSFYFLVGNPIPKSFIYNFVLSAANCALCCNLSALRYKLETKVSLDLPGARVLILIIFEKYFQTLCSQTMSRPEIRTEIKIK